MKSVSASGVAGSSLMNRFCSSGICNPTGGVASTSIVPGVSPIDISSIDLA